MIITLPPPNGDICFTLTYKKVKNINLRLHPDGHIQVSAPRQVPRAYIESFVAKNAPRLRQMRQHGTRQTPLCDGMRFTLFGAPYRLQIGASAKSENDIIGIKSGDRALFAHEIKRLALPRIQALCQKYLPLFAHVCPTLPSIKMRQMKTQWANCNVSDNVSGTPTQTLTFSVNLAFAPIEAIEYVVVHELCHFIHPNHSPSFYAEVEKVLPDWKQRRELLKNTSFMLN